MPANALHFDTPFLTDIAHNADPAPLDPTATRHAAVAPTRMGHVASADFASQPAVPTTTRCSNAHFIAGDGRVNENIGLTAIHQIFHSEHDRLVGDIKNV